MCSAKAEGEFAGPWRPAPKRTGRDARGPGRVIKNQGDQEARGHSPAVTGLPRVLSGLRTSNSSAPVQVPQITVDLSWQHFAQQTASKNGAGYVLTATSDFCGNAVDAPIAQFEVQSMFRVNPELNGCQRFKWRPPPRYACICYQGVSFPASAPNHVHAPQSPGYRRRLDGQGSLGGNRGRKAS